MELRLAVGPFNRWLGFEVMKLGDGELELKASWREDWVLHAVRGHTHSGILAAIVDVAADYVIAAELGDHVPTIDLRVDFHKPAMRGDLTAKSKIVRLGSNYSTAEAYVYDKEGGLVASGRGTYFTAAVRRQVG
jgi:uncharacterized protein (TIGR00369 family)